ncbi:MAG: hypothetical protein P4L11_13525 [Geothrix sp.]|nr:hypothetical protein [Geothrix sp.]
MTWRELLEIKIADRGQAAVARELGYSATTLSLVRRDKYPAGIEQIAARVLDLYGEVDCPFLGHSIQAEPCRRISHGPVPTSNPKAIQHWSACQSCPHFKGAKP